MNYKRGAALLAAGMMSSLALLAPAQAQVEWQTSLNTRPVPIPLVQQVVASANDESIYSASTTLDRDSGRIRVARLTALGTEQWVRWLDGTFNSANGPLLLHPDSSASIAYEDSSTRNLCIENISSAGVSRARNCFGSYFSDHRVVLANDGDLYVAYSLPRAITKISPLGEVRWTHIETTFVYGILAGNGIDLAGNYFEIQEKRLRTWSAANGSKLVDTPLSGYTFTSSSTLPNKVAIGRQNLDIALLRSISITSNAQVMGVARYTSSGALIWARDVLFPGSGTYDDVVTVFPADSDGVYISLSSLAKGESQIARLTNTGVILWQKHYASVGRIINSASGFLAIRSDATAASNSYIFSISAVDGSLGSPIIYSRTDSLVPSHWYAVAAGVVATFQGGTFYGLTPELAASTIFLGTLPSNRWVAVAMGRLSVSIAQSDSLMPRLARSSPSSWWARTQLVPSAAALSDWTMFALSSGDITARTAQSFAGSGAPITGDGGQVIIDNNTTRAKKVDPAGGSVWQAASSVYPINGSQQPIQMVSSSDVTTYLVGSLLGRVSATGSILFETETNRANPRYLAVDSANNAWAVAGYSGADGYVSKVSPTGALLWSASVDAPACSDSIMSARLTASDEMLVATQSCNEGRLFKINATGQIVWQRVVSGTTLRPLVQLTVLQLDAVGNIYAGGCALNNNSPATDPKGISLVASWTSAGTERWSAQSDLIGGAPECVTSIATDSSNNVYAATSSRANTRAPVLWSFTTAGVERWRHSGVLSSPFAASTELAIDASDKLLVLGEAPPNSLGPREATVRRINVATLGSSLRLKFLTVPSTPIGYREQFPMLIGLRTAADAPVNATTPIAVVIALGSGTGNLEGSLTCTIAVGASECTVADSRYDVVETGVTATAGADGFATVVSPAFAFTSAATTTTLSLVSAAPYTAFSTIRVRAAMSGPPAPSNQFVSGNLYGPTTATGQYGLNCLTQNSTSSPLMISECDVLAYSAASPLAAQFTSYDSRYSGSTATPLTLPITKVAPTLQVSLDPDNTNVAGDRFKLRFTLKVGALNVSQYVSNTAWTASGGPCANFVFSGSYWTCEIASATVGSLSLTVSFVGNNDLLAVSAAAPTVNITNGAVLRGSGLSNLETVCSPTPGVTCSVRQSNGYNWQCVGPVAMSGQVFFIPSPSVTALYFPNSPFQFSNVNGLVTDNTYQPQAYVSSACSADVDGDGARLAMTDGVLILRRMLGLTGAALTTGATNVCAPRSAAGITNAINLPGFDLDGDGQTRPETDGVLLLRAILGFRGDALIANAVGANATRKTATAILDYLNNTCSFTLN